MPDHKKRDHALLSASGASRWLNCSPSARLEDDLPNTESEHAKEGTYAHELAELKIRNHLDPKNKSISDQLREKRKSAYYTKEFNEYVDVYVGYVIERYNSAKARNPKSIILIEERLDLTDFVNEGFGTGDAAIVDGESVEVIDLKFGRGVKVDAPGNDQLSIYGLGYLSKFELIYDLKKVTITIVQPRLDHISSDTWETPKLLDWGMKTVKPTAEVAFKGEGEFKVGSWCKFCKIKPTCKAMKQFATDSMKKDFSKAMPKDENDKVLNNAEMAEAFKNSKTVADWAKSVSEHVTKKALSGTKFPGLKLVRGKSNRKWSDEAFAEKALIKAGLKKTDIINSKIKGITDIEKLLGKTEFAELNLTDKPPGAPALVDASDKRPEYDPRGSLEDDFSDDVEMIF